MRLSYGAHLLCVLTAAGSFAQSAVASFSLKPKPVLGSIRKTQVTAESTNPNLLFRLVSIQQSKVKHIEDSGVFYVETEVLSLRVKTSDGEEISNAVQPPTTAKFNCTGELLEVSGKQVGASEFRMGALMAFVAPDHDVQVGDKWTLEKRAVAQYNISAAKVNYELVQVEDFQGAKAAVIRFKHICVGGGAPMNAEGTYWIDTVTGETIKVDAKVFSGSYADSSTVNVKIERIPND